MLRYAPKRSSSTCQAAERPSREDDPADTLTRTGKTAGLPRPRDARSYVILDRTRKTTSDPPKTQGPS